MAFALILCIPDETRTIQRLWRILATKSCSAKDNSDSCLGTLPIHLPFERARSGNLPSDNDLQHVLHMWDKSSSNTGPSMILGGSSWLKRSCIATQGLTKILKSTFVFDNSSKSICDVSLPHTAHPDSEIISGDMS